jgi:hypothetical protein
MQSQIKNIKYITIYYYIFKRLGNIYFAFLMILIKFIKLKISHNLLNLI